MPNSRHTVVAFGSGPRDDRWLCVAPEAGRRPEVRVRFVIDASLVLRLIGRVCLGGIFDDVLRCFGVLTLGAVYHYLVIG